MIAPTPIVPDPPSLLGDVRLTLSLSPHLIDHPGALAALLEADEHDIEAALEALTVEGEVLG